VTDPEISFHVRASGVISVRFRRLVTSSGMLPSILVVLLIIIAIMLDDRLNVALARLVLST